MELYYQYPMVTETTASVLSCTEENGIFLVTLSSSPLFPEGGGQLSDTGRIDSVPVSEVRTVGGKTIHYCSSPLAVGKTVTVTLDVDARLDHSAQHTGEHILSGLAHKLFGAANVGFHMAKDYCTIDLDKFLTDEELKKLELAANEAVRRDLPITTELVSGSEAASRPLRKLAEKLKDSREQIRIVYVDGGNIDSCTCCGTHLHTSGEVGAILITDAQKYKSGVRIWFACGERAVLHAERLQSEVTALARRYSTSREELPTAIEKQIAELSACKQEIKTKANLLSELLSEKLISEAVRADTAEYIIKCFEGFTSSDLKAVTDRIIADNEGKRQLVVLLFSVTPSGTDYRMAATSGVKLPMRELCSAVNGILAGKGGGSPAFAQGKSARTVTDEDIASLRGYLASALR